MELRRVREAQGDAWESMYALYEAAFPYNERRTRQEFINVLPCDDFYCMFLYDGGDMPIGFFTYWETDAFIYGEHFATLPALRGRGFGMETLKLLQKQNKLIALEAEMPEGELACRRVNFYRRAGFVENSHKHMQPPYHNDCALLEMRLMSYPRTFSLAEYQDFYAYVWKVVTGEIFPG